MGPVRASACTWRWGSGGVQAATVSTLSGEPLGNDLLVLRGEQGIGDRIQFANFAAHLAKLDNRVAIWTNPASVSLLRTVPGVERVITDLADIDVSGGARWLEEMSLPHALGTTPETVPNCVPYLRRSGRVTDWRERLGARASRSASPGRAAPSFASIAPARFRLPFSHHSRTSRACG